MSVQNIECQLAKGQIGRYLSGDPLSPEALRQLEAHIAECDDCQMLLQQRRQALMAMITPPKSAKPAPTAVVEVEEESIADKPLVDAIRAIAAENKKPKIKPLPARSPWEEMKKPLIYSLALAIVLVGMSIAAKSFGPKVEPAGSSTTPGPISTAPTEAIATPPVTAAPKAEPTPPKNPAPAQHAAATVKTPPAKPIHKVVSTSGSKPMHVVRRAAPKRIARRAHPAPAHHASRSGIRIYDPSGAPLAKNR